MFTKFGNGFGLPCGKHRVLPDAQDTGCGWIDFAGAVQDFADQGVGFADDEFVADVRTDSRAKAMDVLSAAILITCVNIFISVSKTCCLGLERRAEYVRAGLHRFLLLL